MKTLLIVTAVVLGMGFALGVNAQIKTTDDHDPYWLMKKSEICIEKSHLQKAEGQLVINKGELMVKEGGTMIAHGKEGLQVRAGKEDKEHNLLISQGEEMTKKGKDMVKEGNDMITESYINAAGCDFVLNHAKELTKRR